MNKLNFAMNFPDPSTIFAYHLIAVHHEIFWFIIIILSVVYWALYKIIKEFGWNIFNKQRGLFKLFYYYSFSVYLEAFCLFYYWSFIKLFISSYYLFLMFSSWKVSAVSIRPHKGLRFWFFKKFGFQLGIEHSIGLTFCESIFDLNFDNFLKLTIDKYVNYLLYNKSTNAYFFYDNTDEFLIVQRLDTALF